MHTRVQQPFGCKQTKSSPKTAEQSHGRAHNKHGDEESQGLGKALCQGSRGTGAGCSSSVSTSEPLGAKVQSWRTNYFLPNCPFLGFAPHFPAASARHERRARLLPRGSRPARADGWTQPRPRLSRDGVTLLCAEILPLSKQSSLILRHAAFCCCQSPQ